MTDMTDAETTGSCPVRPGFDPLGPAYLADPHAVMRALPLDRQPVFFAPSIDYYVVTRQADIAAVFRDPETFSAAAAQLPLVDIVAEAGAILAAADHSRTPSMVSMDPPAHQRLRRPTTRAFTVTRVNGMAPTIRARVDELLDTVDDTGAFDLVESLTFPLPANTIFELIGVPREDWARLRSWCGNRATLAWGRPAPDAQVEHARGMAAYRGFLRDLVATRADDRRDDLASSLLDIHDEDPEALSHEEIGSILFSLSFAGHETTNYLIGNAVQRLLEVPERWHRVVADVGLIPDAVEETLRHSTSVPAWRRVTTRPAQVGGVAVPEGAKLFLWLTAAGHDPAVHDRPHAFDLDRARKGDHLAFGLGTHYCLGAALGRLEARLALEGLAARWPGLRLVDGQVPSFHPNISFRGPQALWVTTG